MDDLIERLLRTKSPAVTMRRVSEGHYCGTNAIYINPDGPKAAIRLAEVEAERDALLEAVRPITDDYMTSETHHPNYILIPTSRFAAICAALEAKP